MSVPGGQEQTLFRYSTTWSAYDSSDGGMVRSLSASVRSVETKPIKNEMFC